MLWVFSPLSDLVPKHILRKLLGIGWLNLDFYSLGLGVDHKMTVPGA
jgi:hypothetical protein